MTPTPLEQPTGPALYRAACEVMGYEVEEDQSVLLAYPHSFVRVGGGIIGLDDEWNIFGLIVEWIEARGGRTFHETVHQPDANSNRVVFDVHTKHTRPSRAPTLPRAAALWMVEHGRKIAVVSPAEKLARDLHSEFEKRGQIEGRHRP